jgi:hypothetical protein
MSVRERACTTVGSGTVDLNSSVETGTQRLPGQLGIEGLTGPQRIAGLGFGENE